MNFNEPNEFTPRDDLKIWLNGQLVPTADAKLSVFDHAVLYGDGVFEGLRVYNGKVFRLEQHIKRLEDSARAIRLEIPMTRKELADATNETVQANNLVDGYIRMVVTRGVGTLGISPVKTANPSVFIIADQIALYPPDLYESGLPIVSSSFVRNHPNTISPRIKSLNYLNNILAKVEALDAGCYEAVMYNHLGFVAECSGDNIFLVRDGKVQTPPISAGILEGITRGAVIELILKRGITFQEMELCRHDLYVADECFLTGTAAEVIPVAQIDGRRIGTGRPGTITKQLIADFKELIQRKG